MNRPMKKDLEVQYLEILLDLYRIRRATMLARREKEKIIQEMYRKYEEFTTGQRLEMQQLQWEMELLWQRNVESCKLLYCYLELPVLPKELLNISAVSTLYTLLHQGTCDSLQQAIQVYQEAVRRGSIICRLDEAVAMADRLSPIQSELKEILQNTWEEAARLNQSGGDFAMRTRTLEQYRADAMRSCEVAQQTYQIFVKYMGS